MSSEAVGWVLARSPVTGVALLVHVVLADAANADYGYELWMRQGALALKARTTRQTVNKVLAELEERGLLELVNATPGGTNRYRLLMPELPSIGIAGPGPVTGSTARRRVPPVPPMPQVSPPATPPTAPVAVGTGDNPVATDDTLPSAPATTLSPGTTQNPREPKKEPKKEPKGNPTPPSSSTAKVAKAPKGRQFTDAAEAVARAEWDRRKAAGLPQPVIGFVAFRAAIDAALAAGHGAEDIARVLPAMTNYSRNAFDFVLNGSRPGRRAPLRAVPPLSTDREAPSGKVVL